MNTKTTFLSPAVARGVPVAAEALDPGRGRRGRRLRSVVAVAVPDGGGGGRVSGLDDAAIARILLVQHV